MALLSDYTAGTVTVSAGGTDVTGVGTAWLTAGFQEGDEFFAPGWHGIIQSVNSNTSLTLYATGIRGAALAGSAYRLRYQGDGSRVTAQARQLVEMLGAGNLTALSGLLGAADKLPYFTGAGTMGLATLTAFMRTLLDDTDGATAYGTLGEIPNNQLPSRLRNAVSQTTDANTLVQTGFYGCGGGANGIPVAVFGTILHLQYDSSTTAIQFYWRGTASNQRWMRRKVSNVWGAWVCNSEELLGTVSQSGGVPTGAVIERGSNANGEYVRFADGTQICVSAAIEVPYTGATALQGSAMTWPAAFANNGYGWADAITTLSGGANSRAGVFVPSSITASGMTPRYLTGSGVPYSSGDTRTVRLTAVGRWF